MTTTINASTTLGLQQTADTSGILQLQTASTAALTIDASQNVGIGTSSPNAKVDASGSVNVTGDSGLNGTWSGLTTRYISGNNAAYLQAVALSSGTVTGGKDLSLDGSQLLFRTISGASFTERARIDSSGNLLVGTTNSSGTAGGGFKLLPDATFGGNLMSVVGSATTNSFQGYYLYSTGAGAARFYVGYGGTVYATSTTITGISDQRLKENIRDLDDGLEKVMALKPRKFDWKENKGKGIANDRGFIAQEFEQVFPDMIEQWQDPAPEGEEPYKAVNANLIPTLVKAIQEQQDLITTLTERVAALENQ